MKTALISVSNKEGIVEFARFLAAKGYRIISTGGTANLLMDNAIAVIPIKDVTGFPEILGGRVKTLHPKIFGGILARSDQLNELAHHTISQIDLVVVNLYPFEQTIKQGCTMQEAIEQIDIGGVALLRAAAKNAERITVISDPSQYQMIIDEIKRNNMITSETRNAFAIQAFQKTAQYDTAISAYLAAPAQKQTKDTKDIHLVFQNKRQLRYGENAHQQAVLFTNPENSPCIAHHIQYHGKELSYNNFVDGNDALEAVLDLKDKPAVAIIKHTNPCGYATGKTLRSALEEAWAGDPVSAFGSVIACSQKVDLETAEFLKGKFVEMLIAPAFTPDALEYLKSKSKHLRLLEIKNFDSAERIKTMYKNIGGGLLKQDTDRKLFETWNCPTANKFPEQKKALAEFTIKAAKHTKSNAVILGWEYQPGYFKVLGMGAGQPNRVNALKSLAVPRAIDNLKALYDAQQPAISFEEFKKSIFKELVLVSDAFFPFDDTVRAAAEHNIKYIVQPGGSIRDQEVIDACNELGQAMIFTSMRHFKH